MKKSIFVFVLAFVSIAASAQDPVKSGNYWYKINSWDGSATLVANPDKEGYLVMSLTGKENDYEQAVHRLQGMGVSVQDLMDRVKWDKDACTQCGACTAVCPSGALSLRRPEMTVEFDSDKCVVCHMCIQACPVNAVKLDF